MANLIGVRSYAEATELLGKRDSLKLGHNTYLQRRGDDRIAVLYHRTDVVTYEPGRFMLNTGGWQTVTTKQRINDCSPASVYQRKGDWYFGDDTPFIEREWLDETSLKPVTTGCTDCDSGVPHYACMRG